MDSIAPAPTHAATGLTFTLSNAMQRSFHRCGKTFFATKQCTTHLAIRHWISCYSRCQPQQSRKEISRRVCRKLTPSDKSTESGTFRPLQFIGIQTLHCIPCHLFSVRCIEPRYNDNPLTSPAPIPSPHLKSSSNKPGKGGKIQIRTTAPQGLHQAKIEREVRNFHPIFYLYTRNCSRSHALQQRHTRERFPHQTA